MTTSSVHSRVATPIAAATVIGRVRLTVPDLKRSRAFYERLLGLEATANPDGSVALAPARWPALLELVGDSAASPRNPRHTGLYHYAILVPTRRDLAVALVRLIQGGWRLSGASDHLVSEALYLDDPDGNGIEIYRDRPRSDWRHESGGTIAMATLPLDLDSLLEELRSAPIDPDADALMPPGTRIGHMHLQVADIATAERFYVDTLGFEVTARLVPSALFISAGGYHHHIGMNTWHSRGGQAPPPGAVGLRTYEIKLPEAGALAAVVARVDAAGAARELTDDGSTLLHDPSGNAVLLTL